MKRSFILIFILISISYGKTNIYTNQKYDHYFLKYGEYYDVNPLLLKGIAIVESSMNSKATNGNTNNTIDIGLMQLNTYWYNKLPKTKKPKKEMFKNTEYSIAIAAWIVSKNTMYKYNWDTVGYYHSMNKVHRDKWVSKLRKELKNLRKYKVNINLENGMI